MATEDVKGFSFGVFGVALVHRGRVAFIFVADDLLPALVKVHIKEYHVLLAPSGA